MEQDTIRQRTSEGSFHFSTVLGTIEGLKKYQLSALGLEIYESLLRRLLRGTELN